MPSVICVRSFVPKLKNSASFAMRSAISAARGTSIIVPTMKPTRRPCSRKTSSATRSTISRWCESSASLPISGTMISGITSTPSFAQMHAASRIARACISVISG